MSVDELDFTLELTSEDLDRATEYDLFAVAERRLRALADGHRDMRGAAISMRRPDGGPEAVWHDATVVVYARSEQLVATSRAEQPLAALEKALDSVERQIREKRERMRH